MYRDVRTAINEKDKTVVQDLVREQVAGGADVIDVNLGPTKGDAVGELRLAGPDRPRGHRQADLAGQREARPAGRGGPQGAGRPCRSTKLVINSCTAAPESMAKLIPLAAEHADRHHRPDDGPGGRAGQRGEAGRVRGDVPDDGDRRRHCPGGRLPRSDHPAGQRRLQAAAERDGGDPAVGAWSATRRRTSSSGCRT